MAVGAPILLAVFSSSTDGTTYTITPSIAPTGGRVVRVDVASTATAANLVAPTLSGVGITWSPITTVLYDSIATPTKQVTSFWGTSPSPSAGNITISFTATQTNCCWLMYEYPGTHTTTPIVQSLTNRSDTAGTTASVTLSPFSSPGNASTAVTCVENELTITPRAAWVEISQVGVGSVLQLHAQYRLADDDASATWSGALRWGIIGIELKEAAAAPAGDPITQLHPTALPGRRYGSFVRAAADTALAGTSTLTLTAAGTLTTSIRLAGTSLLSLTTTGSLTGPAVGPITQLHPTALPGRRYGSFNRVAAGAALAGTSTLSLTAAGALTTSIRLAGTSTLTLTTTGSLAGPTGAALAGTSTLRLTATGTLTTAIRLAGTSTLRLFATGSFPSEALPVAARTEAKAVEFYARVGPVRAGTRDYVTPSWIADPSWITDPDSWLTLRRVHQAMILEEPHVTREIQWDDALGYLDVSRGSIRLAGVIPELWEAQGQPYQHWRHDRRVVPTMTRLEYTGLIDRVSLDYAPPAGPSTLVEFTTQSLAVLETLIPQRLTSTTLFGETCPEPGVPIQKVIGYGRHVRLTHVVDDRPIELSVYLVSEGAVDVTNVYRNRLGGTQLEVLLPTEYSVHTGLYAGLTVVLTAKIQWMSSGGFHTLYADVSGPAGERNPAITAALVLGDPTWGGGLPIQVDRVMAEAALIPAGLVLDGVIGGDGQQRSLRDWLKQILSVRGGLVDYDPEAGWSVRFDSVAPTSAAMTLRTGPGVGEQTLLGVGSRVRPALDASVKTLRIRYGYDAHTEAYRYTTSDRAVSTEGRIDVRDHDLLQDSTSADLVAYYIAKRLAWAKDRVEGALAVEEARVLEPLDIVHVVCPQLLLAGNDRRVLRVAKGSGEHELVHEYWDLSIYTHAGGTPPPAQALNPGVGTPVSFFGNVDLTAQSITNPTRMATVENAANPSLSVPGLDTDLVVMTYTTVSAMSLVLLIGRSHIFQYTGTATGSIMQVTLKLRVNGTVMTDQGWSQFDVLDTVAQGGAFGQTLSLVGAVLLPQGTHTLTLQGVVTKGPWLTFVPTLTITEFAR